MISWSRQGCQRSSCVSICERRFPMGHHSLNEAELRENELECYSDIHNQFLPSRGTHFYSNICWPLSLLWPSIVCPCKYTTGCSTLLVSHTCQKTTLSISKLQQSPPSSTALDCTLYIMSSNVTETRDFQLVFGLCPHHFQTHANMPRLPIGTPSVLCHICKT